MYTYEAKVIDVYDGDTITAIVDLGFHINVTIKVRLYGINAPEIKGSTRDAGIKSRDWLSEQVLNKTLTINTFKDKQEKYGRWLGTLSLPGIDKTINQTMIDLGLAVEYMDNLN